MLETGFRGLAKEEHWDSIHPPTAKMKDGYLNFILKFGEKHV